MSKGFNSVGIKRLKLTVACSGELGFFSLKAICHTSSVVAVMTDRKSQLVIDECNKAGIQCFIGNPRKNSKALGFISSLSDTVLLSVNYLFLFDKDTLGAFRAGFNIHGSLLPKYRGRTPHVWAIINNEKQCGITIHELTENCDAGDVYLQKVIDIEEDDTGADILEKYKKLYPSFLKEFLYSYSEGTLVPQKQDNKKATFFGKRTPEDGLIDWGWQRERIRNWVRAQAFPYPGAFTRLHGAKIIINKVVFTDDGYSYDNPNGLVLWVKERAFGVKTPNGVVCVLDYIIEGVNRNVFPGEVLS